MKMNKKSFLMIVLAVLLVSAVFAQQLPIGIQRLKQQQEQLALSITFLLAFFAGLISMTSPCGFALLPTFFSVAFKSKKKAMLMASAFSLGLLAAFTMLGLIAGYIGDFFNSYKLTFAVVSGYILIFFGILLFFNLGFSIFNFKLDYRGKGSFFSVAMLGFFFGAGWTPCVGPILLGILILAANASTALNGTLMLVFYSIGVIVPLLILAYFSDKYALPENQGTFFFQTELPKFIPWSMSFWGYLNEMALDSKIFASALGNLLGIFIVLLLIFFVARHLKAQGDDKN